MDSLLEQQVDLIYRLNKTLQPIPTGTKLRHESLKVRAVIFDVYGTLLISAAGDVGPDSSEDDEQAFIEALIDGGWSPELKNIQGSRLLREEISRTLRDKINSGIRFPEIDILKIWRNVLLCLGLALKQEINIRLAALSYECRTNPVWLMPGLLEMLSFLRQSRMRLGLLSNAQFYTPLLFETLCRQSLAELGFEPNLCLYSYKEGEGKPSPNLYSRLTKRLAGYDIYPSEVLYVGNDMLKDILPAGQAGWKTALFAGDKRSLRLRENEPAVHGRQPDLVIDDLRQLRDILVTTDAGPKGDDAANQGNSDSPVSPL